MKIFIDTGSVREIQALVPLGIIDGITTNPSLLAKESDDPRAIIKEICRIVGGPVSAEVVTTDTASMIAEGRELAAIDEHVVVKIPFTRDGIRAIKALSDDGIRVNTTLIFSMVHGDEVTPLYLGLQLAHWMHEEKPDLEKMHVVIAPLVNPDGFFRAPPAYPLTLASTPFSRRNAASRHQKQPPPNVAISVIEALGSWLSALGSRLSAFKSQKPRAESLTCAHRSSVSTS